MSHVERLRRNDKSRNRAERFGEEWDVQDDEFLQAFWKDEDEEEVAEALGRTIEACRQRFYIVRRGEVQPGQPVGRSNAGVPRYIGAFDDPDDQWWSPDYYTPGK